MQAGTTCWIWGGRDHGESPTLYWHHHHLVRWAGAHIGRFMVHCALMLLFSALRTGAVNRWHKAFAILQPVWQRSRRCRRAAGGTGYPRGGAGVVVTALVQAVLGGIGLAVSAYLMQLC